MRCVLGTNNFAFVGGKAQSSKNDSLLVDPKSLYLLVLHFRFSSLFYSTQLVDLFSYELPLNSSLKNLPEASSRPSFTNTNKGSSTVSVYNFHVLSTQNRFFVFSQSSSNILSGSSLLRSTSFLPSITELFSSAN